MVTHTEVLAQFQAANMAVFTVICNPAPPLAPREAL
jgi:hypothetical protein